MLVIRGEVRLWNGLPEGAIRTKLIMSARKLGFNAVIYGIGGMLNRIIGFLLLPLFTHVLSPEDFGRAGMLQILSTFLAMVFSAGIGGSLSSCYYNAETPAGKQSAIGTATLMLALSCLVMLAMTIPAAPWLSRVLLDSSDWANLVIISVMGTACSILFQPFMMSLQFEERSRLFVSLSAITTVITAGCNLVALVWLRMGLYGWVASQAVGQALSLVLYALPVIRRGSLRPARATLRQLFRLGLPMIFCFGCMYVLQQGNRFLVENFFGLRQLGIYSLAASVAAVSSLAVTAFQTSWTPYFMGFRKDPVGARSAFGRMTTYYFYFMGLVVVCFFSFAQPVIELMTRSAFHDAWLSVGSVALSNVLLGAAALLTPAQYFSEKLGHLTIMQSIAAPAALNINIWVFALAGPHAAGFALALSYGFLLLVHLWWNVRGISMKLPVDYEWGKLGLVTIAVAAAAAGYLAFPASSVAAGLFRGLLGPAAFCALLWIMATAEQRRGLTDCARRFVPSRLLRAAGNSPE